MNALSFRGLTCLGIIKRNPFQLANVYVSCRLNPGISYFPTPLIYALLRFSKLSIIITPCLFNATAPASAFLVAPANRLSDLAACSGLEPDKGASLQAVYPFRGMMRFIRFSAAVPFHPRADVRACPPTGEGNPAGGKRRRNGGRMPSTL